VNGEINNLMNIKKITVVVVLIIVIVIVTAYWFQPHDLIDVQIINVQVKPFYICNEPSIRCCRANITVTLKNNENRTVLCKIKIETFEPLYSLSCENKTVLIEPYSTTNVTANNLIYYGLDDYEDYYLTFPNKVLV